jgi:hypothetical protein
MSLSMSQTATWINLQTVLLRLLQFVERDDGGGGISRCGTQMDHICGVSRVSHVAFGC